MKQRILYGHGGMPGGTPQMPQSQPRKGKDTPQSGSGEEEEEEGNEEEAGYYSNCYSFFSF